MTQRAKMMPYPFRIYRGWPAALLAIVLLPGCQAISPAPVAAPSPIEAIADAYVDALLARYPSMATAYDLPGWRHDRLFDNSQAGLQRWHDQEDRLSSRGARAAGTERPLALETGSPMAF